MNVNRKTILLLVYLVNTIDKIWLANFEVFIWCMAFETLTSEIQTNHSTTFTTDVNTSWATDSE